MGAETPLSHPEHRRLLTTAALGEETLASASSSSDSDTGGASPPPRKKHRASAAEGAGEPVASTVGAGLHGVGLGIATTSSSPSLHSQATSAIHFNRSLVGNLGVNMQANGAGQESSELSCLNSAQNGVGTSNGASTGPGSGTVSAVSGSDASSKKKKRLSQAEEDVIRLIGQHLHGLGLK